MIRLLLVALALVLAAGCGGEDAPTELQDASAYFILDERVWPVYREIPAGDEAAEAVVSALAEGPSADEAELGLTSDLSEDLDVEVADGIATVDGADDLSTQELAQLVYSLTQPAVGASSVQVDGTTYTRADFEEQTPSVLVESPLAFQEVTTPFTATGTANTFEATFHYELLDAEGSVLDENFVTATSGTGTRGTFEFITDDVQGVETLVVFEISAEDGSRMREVEIPLTQAS